MAENATEIQVKLDAGEMTVEEFTDIIKRVALRGTGGDYERAADYLRELLDLRIGWTDFAQRTFTRAIGELDAEIGPTQECATHADASACVAEPEECHS